MSQNSIPAPEATVPNTPEEKIPKSLNGEGVKNSRKQATPSTTTTQDSQLCFRCKQPGHLKKDCPKLPYCSKCRTQGHIPAKCPTKQQDNRLQDERCESADKRHETCREDWEKSQDRPQFSNKTSKCLNCAGDHGSRDCPTRQQPHTPPISNPANGTGIYKNSSQSQNHSPQHSQQSASTMNISTPMLMVNNPLQSGPRQGQQQHSPPQMPPPNRPANSPIRHNQFSQQFEQPPMPQVSQLMAPPQQYNPHIPPPYFHHYPPTNSPSVDSNELLLARVFHRQIDMAERQEKCDQEREERKKCREECEKCKKREANQRAHINKAFQK